MAEKRPKAKNYVTPDGVAKYAHLNQPQTNFKAQGVYGVHLILDPNDATVAAWIDGLRAAETKGFAEAQKENPKAVNKTVLVKPDTSKDSDGNDIPTGKVVVKFSHDASGTRKDKTEWTWKPDLFDSTGVPLPKGIVVYGGSKIAVSYQMKTVLMPTGDFYLSLKLQGVQVLSLVDSFTREASSFGFAKRDGYVAESQDAFGEEVPVDEAGAEEPGVADF